MTVWWDEQGNEDTWKVFTRTGGGFGWRGTYHSRLKAEIAVAELEKSLAPNQDIEVQCYNEHQSWLATANRAEELQALEERQTGVPRWLPSVWSEGGVLLSRGHYADE